MSGINFYSVDAALGRGQTSGKEGVVLSEAAGTLAGVEVEARMGSS